MLTLQEIQAAQASWGAGVVAIGAHSDWHDAKSAAKSFLQQHYSFADGQLLFCPTKAAVSQFRSTPKDALSYFVGRDADHPEDAGFALEPWTGVRFENTGVVFKGDVAMAMGNYFFSRADGSELKVEYSFAYVSDEAGQVKIQLHHSALVFGTQPK